MAAGDIVSSGALRQDGEVMGAFVLEVQLLSSYKPWLLCSDRQGPHGQGQDMCENRFSTCRKEMEQERTIQGCLSVPVSNILLLFISGRKACLVFCCGF